MLLIIYKTHLHVCFSGYNFCLGIVSLAAFMKQNILGGFNIRNIFPMVLISIDSKVPN
jgi:hypothetical protein